MGLLGWITSGAIVTRIMGVRTGIIEILLGLLMGCHSAIWSYRYSLKRHAIHVAEQSAERMKKGNCIYCNYPLKGLNGGRCPECGTNNPGEFKSE